MIIIYGALRIDTKAPAYTGEKRKYAGTEYDAGSGLNYMQARYQNPTRGQFISQDPVFWSTAQNLADPQTLNSYSYANGNPISRKDPDGRAASLPDILSAINSFLKAFGVGLTSNAGGNSVGAPLFSKSAFSGQIENASARKTSGTNLSVSWQTQMPDMEGCLKACGKMAGYSPTGNINIAQHNANGNLTTVKTARQGIETIDSYLANGIPVIVGVNRGDGGEISVNTNPASEHYVTIVGSGQDSKGKYYSFYDPGTSRPAAGTSESNKLYVGSGYKLVGNTAYNGASYTVTEVKTK